MKVFISWSGPQSKAVAELLSTFLTDAIQYLQPWVSSKSIDPGTRWNNALTQELQDTRFAVLCVTSSNLRAPWLNFEAGAISTAFGNTLICPYLIDTKPSDLIETPLGTFQSCQADREGTFALLESINKQLAERCLTTEQLKRSFRHAWPSYKTAISNTLRKNTQDGVVFVSAPITSLPDAGTYHNLRFEVLEAIETLKNKFGRENIYSAVQRLTNLEQAEPERIGFQRDMGMLHSATKFILFYPQALPSSVLFEAGYAYALKKPSIYFVRQGVPLPFALEGAARHSSNLINRLEYKSRDDLSQLIDHHHASLFPGQE